MASSGPTLPIDPARLAATRFTDVRTFEELGSTNTELLEAARRGAPEGVVMVTDHQTAGRGRLGRSWSAAPGTSLLMSVLLRPALSPDELPVVNSAAGLAAADAVEATARFRPGLKWPNDLVAPGPGDRGSPPGQADAKLAGMLSESAPNPGDGAPPAVVVGIGFNVAAGAYPPELAATATSCEEVAGGPVDRVELLVAFLEALERRYSALLASGSEATLAASAADSATLGRRVRIEMSGTTLEGVATRFGHHGELVVTDDNGQAIWVSAGDVIHLRPA